MEHLQHYQEIAHLAREQLVESHAGTIYGWGVESVGTEKCSMLAGSHSTSLDSVLSFSRNIQRRILLMCTTLDLSDFLCSICKVTGELILFTTRPPSHFGSNFPAVGFCSQTASQNSRLLVCFS